jgi:hypothetical protein
MNRKAPVSPEMTLREGMIMAGDVMVTVTPGSPSFSGERTRPTMLPVCVVWARASPERRIIAAVKRVLFNITPPPD